MRADQSASVDFDVAVLTNESELDGEPEEAGDALACILGIDLRCEAPEALQKIREDGVGVHRDVSEDVVKDVGCWRVLELACFAQTRDCREAALRQRLEEFSRRKEPVCLDCLP